MVGLLKLCDVDLGPSLTRYVAVDTEVVEVTRQGYLLNGTVPGGVFDVIVLGNPSRDPKGPGMTTLEAGLFESGLFACECQSFLDNVLLVLGRSEHGIIPRHSRRFPALEDSAPRCHRAGWRIAASSIRSDPMTQSAEDCARAILRIFSSQDVRAGHALMYSAVNVQFLESHSAEDFAAGLAYAIDREWLSNENTMIRLTQSGFDESQKLK